MQGMSILLLHTVMVFSLLDAQPVAQVLPSAGCAFATRSLWRDTQPVARAQNKNLYHGKEQKMSQNKCYVPPPISPPTYYI